MKQGSEGEGEKQRTGMSCVGVGNFLLSKGSAMVEGEGGRGRCCCCCCWHFLPRLTSRHPRTKTDHLGKLVPALEPLQHKSLGSTCPSSR